jgi:hypothetical protein
MPLLLDSLRRKNPNLPFAIFLSWRLIFTGGLPGENPLVLDHPKLTKRQSFGVQLQLGDLLNRLPQPSDRKSVV